MNYLTIRNVTIGSGRPKICVPITGTNLTELARSASHIKDCSADLVEWRADWYEDFYDRHGNVNVPDLLTAAETLRRILGDLPILFTFRTLAEGGKQDISPSKYEDMLTAMIESRLVDLIDTEVFLEYAPSVRHIPSDNTIARIISYAHANGIYAIGSNHDFQQTPEKKEILKRLCHMQEMDADIIKIAVMPRAKSDVMILMSAALEMREHYANRPMITISMGKHGMISRLVGEFYGSDITFGAVDTASAPGQANADELAPVLAAIHNIIK